MLIAVFTNYIGRYLPIFGVITVYMKHSFKPTFLGVVYLHYLKKFLFDLIFVYIFEFLVYLSSKYITFCESLVL